MDTEEIDPQEAVERGIAVLNQRGPEGWRKRVNLDELDTGSPFRCVLAQVYEGEGGYDGGLAALNVPSCGAAWGFCDHDNGVDDEWRRQLRQVPR